MWLFMFKIQWLLDFRLFIFNLVYDVLLFGLSFVLIEQSFFEEKFLIALRMPLTSSIFTILFWFLGVGLPFFIV